MTELSVFSIYLRKYAKHVFYNFHHCLPERFISSHNPLAAPLRASSQTAGVCAHHSYVSFRLGQKIAHDARILPVLTHVAVLSFSGTLPEKRLLPCAPHIGQMDGPLPRSEITHRACFCQPAAIKQTKNFTFPLRGICNLSACLTFCIYVLHLKARRGSVRESELSADDGGVDIIPATIADSAPLAVEKHLHPALLPVVAACQSHQGP